MPPRKETDKDTVQSQKEETRRWPEEGQPGLKTQAQYWTDQAEADHSVGPKEVEAQQAKHSQVRIHKEEGKVGVIVL